MRKFFYFLLVITFVATSAIGQPINTSAPAPTYTVQPGDNLWTLSVEKLGNPRVWTSLVHKNPYLQKKGRIFSKGDKTVVLLRPGEKLVGLEELGLLPELLPISELQVSVPATVSASWSTPAPVVVEDTKNGVPGLLWWVVVPLIAAVLAFYLFGIYLKARDEREDRKEREKELSQDPVASGPAVVPGGIRREEVARLESYFQDQASEQSQSMDLPVRISPIEEGTIYGAGMVGYADRARLRKIDPALPGYRARFRFSNGSERVLLSLQACMNPCMWGEGMSGFTFVPGRVVVPAPDPDAPPPASTPTQVSVPSKTSPEVGVIRIEVKPPSGDKPFMVKAVGIDTDSDFTCEVNSKTGEISVRFVPEQFMVVSYPRSN